MDEFDARMAALRARFITQAEQERAQVLACLGDGRLSDLRDICHGLAGRAGMFGFVTLGEAARDVEEAIDRDDTAEHLTTLGDRLLDELGKLPQGL